METGPVPTYRQFKGHLIFLFGKRRTPSFKVKCLVYRLDVYTSSAVKSVSPILTLSSAFPNRICRTVLRVVHSDNFSLSIETVVVPLFIKLVHYGMCNGANKVHTFKLSGTFYGVYV